MAAIGPVVFYGTLHQTCQDGAYIDAPFEVISRCVSEQGKTYKEHGYAFDEEVRQLLEKYVFDSDDSSLVLPVEQESDIGPTTRLQPLAGSQVCRDTHQLRNSPMIIGEAEIGRLVVQGNVVESLYNPAVCFQNSLVSGLDHRTAVDLRTNITWQLGCFWLVDLGRARIYWAAGKCFSGGLGRACRSDRAKMRHP